MNLTGIQYLGGGTYLAPSGGTYPFPILIHLSLATSVSQPKSLVLYLHGWRGICDSVNDSVVDLFNKFSLKQAIDSVTNTIFVMPLSRGHCDDFKNALVPRFAEFEEWMNQVAGPCSSVILAGHSGAYVPMSSILTQRPLFASRANVVALDAIYGNVEQFIQAMKANPNMKLRSVYLKRGGTDEPSKEIVQAIGSRAVAIPAQTTEHCKVPAVHLGSCLKELLS